MNSQPVAYRESLTERNVLMLGGTADARHWAKRAFDAGLFATAVHGDVHNGVQKRNQKEVKDDGGDEINRRLIYSVAGLVRQPDLPCDVISGGFTQFGGLTRYLKEHNIELILDATHPFAQAMSAQAVASAAEVGIPCWRFRRPAWEQQAGDQWFRFKDWRGLCQALSDSDSEGASLRSVLLTVGQLEQQDFDLMIQAMGGAYAFESKSKPHSKRCVLRTAAPPRIDLPDWVTWIKAIGPFDLEGETQVLAEYDIDVLISKNSGGASTEAKIEAARARGIPVFMLDRPDMPPVDQVFDTLDAAVNALSDWLRRTHVSGGELSGGLG